MKNAMGREPERGHVANYSIKYANFSVLVIWLKYLEVSSHVLEMDHMICLKKGKIRECGEWDWEILTQRLILMFHRTPHWWSNFQVSALTRGMCLPACGGQQFPAEPAEIWYHLSASEDGKRHLQGPDPTREQQCLKQPLSDNLELKWLNVRGSFLDIAVDMRFGMEWEIKQTRTFPPSSFQTLLRSNRPPMKLFLGSSWYRLKPGCCCSVFRTSRGPTSV